MRDENENGQLERGEPAVAEDEHTGGAGETVDEALAAEAREESAAAEADERAARETEERGEPAEPLDKLHEKARRLEPRQIEALLEAMLLVAEKPLTLAQVKEVTGLGPDVVEPALASLAARRREAESGIQLAEVAGGWQLRTDPAHAEFIRRFLSVKPQRLTRAALETLALVAYRQPITRPEIEQVRGVDSGAVLTGLLERKLVKILGKKDEPGRPLLYGTTREFLEVFSLKDLASMPTLREFHELTEEHREILQEVAGEEEKKPIAALADNALERMLAERAPAGDEALSALEMAMREAEAMSRVAEGALGTGAAVPGEGAAPAEDAAPAEEAERPAGG